MPTASEPSDASARYHGFDLRQAVAAVAEHGIGGKPDITEIEVAGTAAAEPGKIPRRQPARARRHQEET